MEELNLVKLAKLESLIKELKEEIEDADWAELYHIEDELIELSRLVTQRVEYD
jgi:hypothetical protein